MKNGWTRGPLAAVMAVLGLALYRPASLDPVGQYPRPLVSLFAQHREPCAHVFAALVIMRGGRQHRVREAGLAA